MEEQDKKTLVWTIFHLSCLLNQDEIDNAEFEKRGVNAINEILSK